MAGFQDRHVASGTVKWMSICQPVLDLSPGATLPSPPLPAAGERWALFLDVDGTLLEFADDPRSVTASPLLIALLHELHAALDGALALVSGRTLAELDRVFESPAWTLVGLHGLDLRHADGIRRQFPVAAADQQGMRAAVHELAREFPGVHREAKGVAAALHCRQVPEQFPRLLAAAQDVARGLPGYELQPGNLVVEFKPSGTDKGRAVAELLHRAPFTGRRPVYLGDDLTDERAFALVNAVDGLSIRVGWREPSAARCTLPGPQAVQEWLRGVLAAGGASRA
jgi:trehalose 6-phosphate phosphatase